MQSEDLRPTFILMTICLALLAGLAGFMVACAYLSGSQLRQAREALELAQANLSASADHLAEARRQLSLTEKEVQAGSDR